MARVSTRGGRSVAPRVTGKVNPVEFLQETVLELRKSVWPSREETARLTVVVVVLAVLAAFFLGGLDRALAETFTRYILRS